MEDLLFNKIPILNSSVVIHHRDDEYIVAFTDNKSHLKISSKVYEVINLIDNKRNISQIVTEFNNNFECKIDNEFARELLFDKLEKYRIIESDIKTESYEHNNSPSYLKLNIILINEKLTKFITRPLLFLFSKSKIKLISCACLIVLITTLVFEYSDILTWINNIPLEYIFVYIAVMIASSLFHELGHSAATYYYGGNHSGIGIGFYLLTPVLYSDVSSAWKFEMRKRIVVNLAGIYFELIFGTTLICFALVTGIKALLIIPAIILFKTLFNLFPFFRTDGYWILSDLINIPNLQKTSNHQLIQLLKTRNIPSPKKINLFLILYGLINNILLYVFLGTILVLNPNSLITFPHDVYVFITDLIQHNSQFNLINFSKLLIPLSFYFLLIRLIIMKYIKYSGLKKIKSKNEK